MIKKNITNPKFKSKIQRRSPLHNKNEFTDNLLKSDPANIPKESILLPSIDNWKWLSDWQIRDYNIETVIYQYIYMF